MERIRRREGRETPQAWRIAERVNIARDEARRPSEDGTLTDPECIAALDGVSSGDSTEKIEGLTPGQFAVQVGMEALKDAAKLSDPKEVVPFVSRRLREALGPYTLTTTPSFVFAAFFPNFGENGMIIRVADCSYLIDGVGDNPGLAIDRLKSKDRARRLREEIEQGADVDALLANDPTRPRMRALTKDIQPRLANAPLSGNDTIFDTYRYPVMNGHDVPEDLVEYIEVPKGASSIILATDGYPPQSLKPSLAETEAALKEIRDRDKLAIGDMLSTRGVMPENIDDRSYIRIVRA
ncbi:hypothetical protein JNK62_01200 [bacterium]|nr:hypothetical protein [bacterium]